MRARMTFRSKAKVYGRMSVMRGMGEHLVGRGVWASNPLRWLQGPKLDGRIEPSFCGMRARDTTADAREVQVAALRALGPARRVELALEMSEQARAVSLAGVLAREPELSPEQARARLLRRVVGSPLFDAAWPNRTAR